MLLGAPNRLDSRGLRVEVVYKKRGEKRKVCNNQDDERVGQR